ncbi:anther-specific protein LAT52-like [Magnolia sinica]|uniref:anther-specific protein LAT52-like n=1 Tax=Magnolia sinica TaxID=86752 RepID=UPI002658A963|nr:anther-specific protein LAT52-like [Magnolia sinica]
MAKFNALSILAASLCLFSLLSFASCVEYLRVQGTVYCDTCRAGFETRLSENIAGAKVKIECKSLITNEITFTAEGVTNETGGYNIRVGGDHEEEMCEAVAVSSPRKDCQKLDPERDRGPIVLTRNAGIESNIRYANPLGFMIDNDVAGCAEALKEVGFRKKK